MRWRVVFVDEHDRDLGEFVDKHEVMAVAVAVTGDGLKSGHLFRIGGRMYRLVQVHVGRERILVTVKELSPRAAMRHALAFAKQNGDA